MPGRATSWSGPTPRRSPPTTRCSCARTARCAGTAACAATTGCRRARPEQPGRERVEPQGRDRVAPARRRPCATATSCASLPLDRAIHVVVLSGLAIVLFTFAAHDQALHHDYENIMNDLAGRRARRLPGARRPRLLRPGLQVLAVAPADPGARAPGLRRAGGGRDGRALAQQAVGRVPHVRRHHRPRALRGLRAHERRERVQARSPSSSTSPS